MASELEDRRDYLFLVVDTLLAAHEDWASDNTITGVPEDGPFWEAAFNAVEAFSDGAIPGDCRKLARVVEEFSTEWVDFANRAQVNSEGYVEPSLAMWKSIEEMAGARQRSKPKPPIALETVAELVEQKVSHEQIAHIYGWTVDGQADIAKVRDAIKNPGKWDSADCPNPIKEREEQRLQEELAKTQRLNRQIQDRMPKPAPETIEELVAQNVPLHQIAAMKHISEEEVLDACEAAGIEPPEKPQPLSMTQHPSDRDVSEAEQRQLDALGNSGNQAIQGDARGTSELTEEHRILAMEDDQMSHKDIATALGITRQRVTAICQRREEILETVA